MSVSDMLSYLLQNGMSCGHDKIPDNTILYPTVFGNKSMSGAKKIKQYKT